MLNNRFERCTTLKDLYERFNDDTREYSNVSVAELETIAKVFGANVDVREMPDVPLTDKGYTYIWNYVVDTVEQEEKAMMNTNLNPNETINNTPNKEDKGMKSKVNAAVEEMMSRFQEAKDNIKMQAGETKEEFVERTDESLNIMKDALGNTLNVIDNIVGYSLIKEAVLDMIDASMDGASSKKDLFKMARKCREIIEREIKNLEFWGDEESFRKAVQLKALTEDERGKSIFESFAVGVIWITKKVFRKLNIQSDSEKKGIFASICKGIGAFARVIRAGVKIVWNAVKFAASFVVSGIIIVADFIYHAIKTAVEKIKNWSAEKFQKVTEDEVEDDVFEDEEDSDGVFGTSLA